MLSMLWVAAGLALALLGLLLYVLFNPERF
ncbi:MULTISPECIES: potassium-transporting ATPase subunit F [Chitinibacter]|nr:MULTISPECIES: potassium-transporting ATPase subunit F [Chitinibacter]